MTKRRDRLFIGIALCMVFVVAVFAVLYVLGEKRRNVAVEELKTRASEVEARYHQQRTKSTPILEKDVVPAPTETTETASPSEDSIEAYNKFSEKQIVIDAKAILELLFENDEDKSAQEIDEELAAFCADNQEFIVELRNIAATGGPFYELDFSKILKSELLPHRKDVRRWVQVLEKNGAMAAANGDYEEATKDALAIAGFAEGIGKEPFLISQEMRGSLENRFYDLIAYNIQGENLPPKQAAQIIEYAVRFDPYTGQNYVYKPGSNDFTLYSARGRIVPPDANRTARGCDTQGNIVWRHTGE